MMIFNLKELDNCIKKKAILRFKKSVKLLKITRHATIEIMPLSNES